MHSFSDDLLETYIVDPTRLDRASLCCVETHLAVCEECRRAADLLADFYADLLVEPTAPAELVDGILGEGVAT